MKCISYWSVTKKQIGTPCSHTPRIIFQHLRFFYFPVFFLQFFQCWSFVSFFLKRKKLETPFLILFQYSFPNKAIVIMNRTSFVISKVVIIIALFGKSKKGSIGVIPQQHTTNAKRARPVFFLIFIFFSYNYNTN